MTEKEKQEIVQWTKSFSKETPSISKTSHDFWEERMMVDVRDVLKDSQVVPKNVCDFWEEQMKKLDLKKLLNDFYQEQELISEFDGAFVGLKDPYKKEESLAVL